MVCEYEYNYFTSTAYFIADEPDKMELTFIANYEREPSDNYQQTAEC